MKKIFSLIVFFLIVGCSENYENVQPEKYSESNFRKDHIKNVIKNDIFYFNSGGIKQPPSKFKMYNSIEESIRNQDGLLSYGYKGQEVEKMIHIFTFEDGIKRLVFLSKNIETNEIDLYVKELYYNSKTNKYSDVFASESPISFEKTRSICTDADTTNLMLRQMTNIKNITLKAEPNQQFGFTTEKRNLDSMNIEGKRPDSIKKFVWNNTDYYLWYFEDLKSKKEVDQYNIKYKDNNNIKICK